MNISTRSLPDGLVQVDVAGEIDMATVDQVERALTDAVVDRGCSTLVLDLGGVTFCDSSGIAALDRTYGLTKDRGVRFQVVRLQPPVRMVLQITGVLHALTGE